MQLLARLRCYYAKRHRVSENSSADSLRSFFLSRLREYRNSCRWATGQSDDITLPGGLSEATIKQQVLYREHWGGHPTLLVFRWWRKLRKCIDAAVHAESNFHATIWISATAFAAGEHHASGTQFLGVTSDNKLDATLLTVFIDQSCLGPKWCGIQVTVITVLPNKNWIGNKIENKH